jgi:hypothetical protein
MPIYLPNFRQFFGDNISKIHNIFPRSAGGRHHSDERDCEREQRGDALLHVRVQPDTADRRPMVSFNCYFILFYFIIFVIYSDGEF